VFFIRRFSKVESLACGEVAGEKLKNTVMPDEW